jgi:hypothetical protein
MPTNARIYIGSYQNKPFIDTVLTRLVSFSGCRRYDAGSRIVPEGRKENNVELAAKRPGRW